ncbi:MAG: immunoglobulin-like domain-containing protein [Bacteroidia bacterium]
MKTFVIALFIISCTLFLSCEKESDGTSIPTSSATDSIPPVITLIGSNPMQLEMLQFYIEPGVIANDNEDGDISSSVNVDTSLIDNRLPGTYDVFYTVSDAAGNPADALRDVVVYATNNALAKTYNVVDSVFTISGVFIQVFSYSQTLTASGSNVNIYSLFGDYPGLSSNVTSTVDGNGNITLPSQTKSVGSGDSHTFSGTGQVTSNGFLLVYTDVNNTASASANCRAHYTRQ